MTESRREALRRTFLPAVIILLSTLVTGFWAVLTPIFQAPDEDTHLDYALGIWQAGVLLRAADRPIARITASNPFPPFTHPYTWHLAVRSNALRIRFRPEAKVPPGYGSAQFFQLLEEKAPRDLHAPVRNPWLVHRYPFGYYATLALWLSIVSSAAKGILPLFFGARLLSVLMLPITLAATYAIARRLRAGSTEALLFTAAIGLFPMTSFIASSVQPDNLSFLLCALTILLGLKARDELRGAGNPTLLLLGLSLGALLVTKYHFFLCCLIAVGSMLLAEQLALSPERRAWRVRALALLAPAVLAGAVQFWVGYSGVVNTRTELHAASAADRIRELGAVPYISSSLQSALVNFYAGGKTYQGFWGTFGWVDTPLVIGPPSVDAAIKQALQIATLVLLGAGLFQAVRTWLRLVRVRGRGAWRLAASNPLLTLFGLFTGLMLVLYVAMNNLFAAQGRNWLPVLPGIVWFGMFHVPKLLRRHRRATTRVLGTAFLLYAIVGNVYGLRTISTRFYGNPSPASIVRAAIPGLLATKGITR